MHPRSRYKDNPPVFLDLAAKFSPFAYHLTKHGRTINFQDPDAVRELARALLHVDFGLSVKLPENRLCPMVPNRLNYVLFLQDLIDTTSHDSWTPKPDMKVRGLDIGTGASCIYPLLAVQQRPNWIMVGSELDHDSRLYALRNVTENQLDKRIAVIPPSLDPNSEIDFPTILPLAHVIKGKVPGIGPKGFLFNFTMVNPPFYASSEELQESATKKKLPPNSACTGAPIEMIYDEGGEKGFIEKLIRESLLPRNANYSKWFTTLCGLRSTVDAIIPLLKELGIGNFLVNRQETGESGTIRWVIAWSYLDRRPPPPLAHPVGLPKDWAPETGTLHFTVKGDESFSRNNIDKVLSGLPHFEFHWAENDPNKLWGRTAGDCWSRKYRRAVQKGMNEFPEWESSEDRVGIRIYIGKDAIVESWGVTASAEEKSEADSGTSVSVYWTQGKNRVIFESFSGMLKRALSS